MQALVIRLLILLLIPTAIFAKAGDDLIIALKKNDLDGVKAAIAAGADVNYVDKSGAAAIGVAAIWAESTKLLLDAGANPDNVGKGTMTPLMTAAAMSNAEGIKHLLAAGADVNAEEKKTGLTALHYAAWRSNCAECVRILIDAGADANAKDKNKETPLTLMVSASSAQDRVNTVQYTVNGYQAAGYENLPSRFTNPQLSDFDEPDAVIEALLSADIDPSVTNKVGMNALMYAASFNKVSIMEKLVAKGAKLNAKDKSGMTVFQHAASRGAGDAIAYLVTQGISDVNETFDWLDTKNSIDMKGMTALSLAVLNGSSERAKALIDLGADCTVKSSGTFYQAGNPCVGKVKNKTPLIYAIESGSLEMVQTLVNSCSIPKIKGSWEYFSIEPVNKQKCSGGQTWPRSHQYAAFLGYDDIAEYLKTNEIL